MNVINLPQPDTNKALAIRILVSCVDPMGNAEKLPSILKAVHATLEEIDRNDKAKYQSKPKNIAVALSSEDLPDIVKQTVYEDYIVCLEDNVQLKMLKRHLMSKHGITFEQYKNKHNLPNDYPSVCMSYAKRRSEIAKDTNLGKSNKHARNGDIPAVRIVKNTVRMPIQTDIEDSFDL